MIKFLACSFLITFLTLNCHSSFAQEESYHRIVIKVNSIQQDELSHFQSEIVNQLGFKATKACLKEGYVLIEVPVSLAIRIHQAEESALSLAKSHWGNATLDSAFSVDGFNICAQ